MTTERVAQHHRYSASGAVGWMTCAGKIAMEVGIPDTYSPYADEGSAAHFLGAECLQKGVSPRDFHGRTVVCWEKRGERDGQVFEGESLPEGAEERSRWKVTQEMVGYVANYCSYVTKLAKGGELLVEQRVHFGGAIGVEGAFGTSDTIIVHPKKLIIVDLKYGFKEVSAVKNPQMMLYSAGSLEDLSMLYDLDGIEEVEMHIFQPRLQSAPDSPDWSCNLKYLEAFTKDAKVAVERSEEAIAFFNTPNMLYDQKEWEETYLTPSEKGCQWCKAKGKCPALAKECLSDIAVLPATAEGLANLDEVVVDAIAQIPTLDFDTLAAIYKAKGKFEDWIKAIEARMLSDMLEGQKHPEWKLIKGRQGNRKWQDEEEAELTLKSMRLKLDEMYDKSVKSPTEMEKALKKARPKLWAKVEPLISRADGKTQIAPMSDKRPSINPHDDDLALLPELAKFTVEDLIDHDEIDDLL